MHIFVEDDQGMRVEYHVIPGDPVHTLKQMIEEADGLLIGVCSSYVRTLRLITVFERLPGEQKLEYQGLELQDGDTLETYPISNNSIILLFSKAPRLLFVKMLTGETLSFFIDLTVPASELFQMVEKMGGIPACIKSSLTNGITVNCVLL